MVNLLDLSTADLGLDGVYPTKYMIETPTLKEKVDPKTSEREEHSI